MCNNYYSRTVTRTVRKSIADLKSTGSIYPIEKNYFSKKSKIQKVLTNYQYPILIEITVNNKTH